MAQTHEQNLLPHPVEDVWATDSKLGAVVQGDCYHAESVKGREDVVLWLSREALNEEQQAGFMEHLERLMSVRDWGGVDGGIDAAQRGFVVLNDSSTQPIDFDDPGNIAKRNRFLMCVVLVSQIHEAGFACGNLTPGSFVVDSFGKVQLVGFMGGYEQRESSTIPRDIWPFLRARGDGAGLPSATADVYSLAVMGLALFGVKFPPASIDLKHVDEYLQELDSDAPSWVFSVLATIIKEPQKQFCANSSDMLRAISAKDTDYLEALSKAIAEQRVEAEDEEPLAIDEIRELFVTAEQLRKRRIDQLLQSKVLRCAIFCLIAILVLKVIALQAPSLRGIVPILMTPGDKHGQRNPSVDEVKDALASLKVNAGPSVNRVEHSATVKEDNRQEPANPPGNAATNIEVAAPKKIFIAGDNMVLKYLELGQLSKEDRTTLFNLYGECDDESKSRIATTVAKVGGESEAQFRSILIKQLQRSALMEKEALDTFTTDALFLAAEGRLSRDAAAVWGRLDALSDDELWWLLRVHSRKRSPIFSELSKLIIKRRLIASPKDLFFAVAAAAEENSGAPYEALFRGGTEGVTTGDVQLLSIWTDPLAVRSLFAVLLSTSDPEISARAIAAILTKPAVDGVVRATIEELARAEGYEPGKVGKLIGALGFGDGVSEETIAAGFESVKGHPAQQSVLEVILHRGSPRVVEAGLRIFGKDMHPDMLIHLLDRPEASIRRAVIPFLKEAKLASSKARIREKYELEQDPEVRRLFEVEIYQ